MTPFSAGYKTKRLTQDITKTIALCFEADPKEAARRRLEFLNTAHRRAHKLEFVEFLREEFQARTKDSGRKSLAVLETTHKKIHQLWLRELSTAGLKSDGKLDIKELWKLKSDYLLGDFGSFVAELQRKFKLSENEQRKGLIFSIIDATDALTESIEDRLEKRGFTPRDLLYDYLFASYECCRDRPLQDCFQPRKDKNGFSTMGELRASEILKRIEADREKRRHEVDWATRGLVEELGQLNPPLTWGEVLSYFIEDIATKDRLDKLFFPSGNRYCLECDKPFLLSKNNPGYFRCPRCSAKIRQRRKRERERKALKKVKRT